MKLGRGGGSRVQQNRLAGHNRDQKPEPLALVPELQPGTQVEGPVSLKLEQIPCKPNTEDVTGVWWPMEAGAA